MSDFHFRRITDPVHGTFGISELDSDIISTPIFQRLYNVRQLGLAYLVYPGADYSRFAHSLGACHLAGRMFRSISHNCKRQLDKDQLQYYRLAGLLHDLGHYPFSHTTEDVVLDYYKEESFIGSGDTVSDAPLIGGAHDLPPPAYGHEVLGRSLIKNDERLGTVLSKHDISAGHFARC